MLSSFSLVLGSLVLAAAPSAAEALGTTRPSWQTRSFDFNPNPALYTKARQHERRTWGLSQPGTTGVGAMQAVVVSSTQILIIDKVQHNPLTINNHTAWSSIYSLVNHIVRPVDVVTNSFCAGGSFLSNGTLANVGGNVAAFANGSVAFPQPIPNTDGDQGMRHFNPSSCSDSASQCAFQEWPKRVRLTSMRWYPTSVRLQDGSLLVIGGSIKGTFMNSAALNNPTIEFYPPKAHITGYNGTAIPSPFLNDTLNANLFVISFLLPNGNVFVAGNTKAMIYNWQTNTETRLPDIPNGVRISYPMAGTGVLLPLRPPNYDPTVMICGGQARSDTVSASTYSALDTASSQCASITLTTAGITAGWKVETLPGGRIMPDVVMLPTGKILIVNGGASGYSGYGNVQNQVGQSNADNPRYTPVIYDETIPLNASNPSARFSSTGLPTSTIPRLYHSVATLTGSGEVWIAGSSPHEDVSNVTYPTEYRAEIMSPDYVSVTRPVIASIPSTWLYNTTYAITLQTAVPTNATVEVMLMDFGFSTHSIHQDLRAVQLQASALSTLVSTQSPPTAPVYPPGPGWIFVVINGIPSIGQRVMIGSGAGPPVDIGAWNNMLATTPNP